MPLRRCGRCLGRCRKPNPLTFRVSSDMVMMRSRNRVILLTTLLPSTLGAGCYCRTAGNGCVANDGCQCGTQTTAATTQTQCTAISGSWEQGCCMAEEPPPPPAPFTYNSSACPQNNLALCDNGGACGTCFMLIPSADCVYGRSIPECHPDLVGFGNLCSATGYPIPQHGFDATFDDNGIHTCGTSRHENNCTPHAGMPLRTEPCTPGARAATARAAATRAAQALDVRQLTCGLVV